MACVCCLVFGLLAVLMLGFVCNDGLLAGISLFLVCGLQVGWVVRFEVFYGLVVISCWSVCGYLFSFVWGVLCW